MTTLDDIRVELAPIDVWVTPNIAIYRQLTMFDATHKEFHFVPATVAGYVIVTAHNALAGSVVKRGFCLYRPAGLELCWHCDKTINFRVLSVTDAWLWRFQSGGTWEDIVASGSIRW